MEMPIQRLFAPTFLALLSVFFEGISIGLLIPLLQGLLANDFQFVHQVPVLKHFLAYFPQEWFQYPLGCFFVFVGIIFVSTILTNLLAYASMLSIAQQVMWFANKQRQILFARYLHFGKLFMDQADRGHLIHILVYFSQQISNFLNTAQKFFAAILQFVLYFSLLMLISWPITCCIFVLFPILHVALRWLIRKIEQTSYKYVQARKALWHHLYNVLECWPLIQTSNMVQLEIEHFQKYSDNVQAWDWSMEKKWRFIGPLQQILIQSFILVFVSIMALQIWHGRMQLANFLVYLYLLKKLASSLGIWSQLESNLAQLKAPLEEVQQMLADDKKYKVADGTLEFQGLNTEIRIQNLNFGYSGELVLKNFCCVFPKSQTTALIGPTGCGKTTLMSLLLRFYDVPPNTILLDGVDIREFSRASLYSHIALVSQNIFLFHDTLRMNILYGNANVSNATLDQVIQASHLTELVNRLPNGLDSEIGDHGVRLSGGEKQRVALARALLQSKADIIILDEPTSSLDGITQEQIYQSIRSTFQNCTVILITHAHPCPLAQRYVAMQAVQSKRLKLSDQ